MQDLLDIGTENVGLETYSSTEVSESIHTGISESEQPLNKPLETSERKMLYTEINNIRRERDEALERNNSACQMMTGMN